LRNISSRRKSVKGHFSTDIYEDRFITKKLLNN
jgi:hypothetical protein